jgi:hypothetical protein
LIFSELG